MECTEAYVTRPDIQQFPFPYKLWLVVHLEMCDFVLWDRDGTVILVDLVPLEDYLNSPRSIFKIKNRSIFLEHLEQFQFERLNAKPEAEEDLVLQYKNENFKRCRLDLLAKIRRPTYQILGETKTMDSNREIEAAASQLLAVQVQKRVLERMNGDMCFMSCGTLSNIHRNRIRLQTILNFQKETRILRNKLRASDEHAAVCQAQQRRMKSAGGIAAPVVEEEQQVIELPVELFENPHDSVLNLGTAPEYAGYYGNCNKEQIMRFFGDYLPKYENGTVEVKKVVADSSADFSQKFTYSDIETCDSLPPNEADIQVTSTPIQPFMQPAPKAMSSLNISSGLEPIFKTDEEEFIQCDYKFNADTEAEISMEEFITFNADIENEVKTETEMPKYFPQMPSAVKMEIAEENGAENEANFRNFFSQYRASLNLLYDKH